MDSLLESWDRYELIEMMKEALEIGDEFDYIKRRRWDSSARPIEFYYLENFQMNNYIIDFQFITDECLNIFCTNEHPCADCLNRIEKFKFYFRAMKIIDADKIRGVNQMRRLYKFLEKRNIAYRKYLRAVERRRKGGAADGK